MSIDVKDAPAEVAEAPRTVRDPDAVRQDALALTRAQRRKLVHELLDSLDEEDDDDLEEPGPAHRLSPAWEAEIERRIKAYDAGLAKTVSWEEARAVLEATVNKYRVP